MVNSGAINVTNPNEFRGFQLGSKVTGSQDYFWVQFATYLRTEIYFSFVLVLLGMTLNVEVFLSFLSS